MLKHVVAGLAWLASNLAAAAVECEPGSSIWTSRGDSTVAVYFPEGLSIGRKSLVFEGWTGSRITWRIVANTGCSNGVVFCFVTVPTTKGDGHEIEAPITEVTEGKRWEYLVFGHLAQATYRFQNYDVEYPELAAQWFISKPEGHEDRAIYLPSFYKFTGCQRGDELLAGQPSAEDLRAPLASVNGKPFASARSTLIDAGWRPRVPSDNLSNPDNRCTGRPEICSAYDETEYCAGTGLGTCSFVYVHGNAVLRVTTVGEALPDLGISGWRVSLAGMAE